MVLVQITETDARAGFGIWFGNNDERNVSESLGPQTNNRAELLAIIRALTILRDEIEQGQQVMIYSDSSYSIVHYIRKKMSKKVEMKGNDIPNRELEVAYNFVKKYNNIKFTHIRAHTDLEMNIQLVMIMRIDLQFIYWYRILSISTY